MKCEAQPPGTLPQCKMSWVRRDFGTAAVAVPAAWLLAGLAVALALCRPARTRAGPRARSPAACTADDLPAAAGQRRPAAREGRARAEAQSCGRGAEEREGTGRPAAPEHQSAAGRREGQRRAAEQARTDRGAPEGHRTERPGAGADLARPCKQTQATLDTTRRGGEQASAQLSTQLAAQTRRADACEEKNAQLYSVTMDLIDRYRENRGAWEKFLLSEPFTGLKSVEVENLLDDMRSKAKDSKVEPAAAAQPAARSQ